MPLNITTLCADDIEGVELIQSLVLECEYLRGGDDTDTHPAPQVDQQLAQRFARIGRILRDNALRLNLDEEINQLTALARCIGCQALSPAQQERHFGGDCWAHDPRAKAGPDFRLKQNGKNGPNSCVMPVEKQQAVMAIIALVHMRRDPVFTAGAEKLLRYEERNKLWTIKDGENLWA